MNKVIQVGRIVNDILFDRSENNKVSLFELQPYEKDSPSKWSEKKFIIYCDKKVTKRIKLLADRSFVYVEGELDVIETSDGVYYYINASNLHPSLHTDITEDEDAKVNINSSLNLKSLLKDLAKQNTNQSVAA